ncbi:hypothetical protein RclHR1_07530008 [Rhizophagus clarus]|uniref:Uncharacterized protein n=1 Tax=Rhizophagus clarus TaxID=94130 RepID=A0A2Z6SLN1_9GLOM|nr:hypothetical protein RclHR1_07530008 [Rhizophagus clarus]GES90949.1 hypothetical protein GLOIN_2v1471210 [Rhizophagus clarus]
MISNIIRTKSTTTPNQVYMVPLPDFTLYPEGIDNKRKGCWMIFLKFLKLPIWPRGHMIKKEEKMSPFLRMIRNENSAEIYDNPSIAAMIDFKWNLARNFFFRQILLYFIFAVDFALIVGAIRGIDEFSILVSIENYELRDLIIIVEFVTFYWIGVIY